jgi:hypothetical protein
MIGITNNTFEFRYSAEDLLKMSLIYREKYDHEWGGKDAMNREKKLKRQFKRLLYKGKSPIKSKSSGFDSKSVEIFTADILGLDK